MASGGDTLWGDSWEIYGNARGGNDTLIGGDAFDMRDNARGGDDTLISGTGTDHMWGDGQLLNGVAASPMALPAPW